MAEAVISEIAFPCQTSPFQDSRLSGIDMLCYGTTYPVTSGDKITVLCKINQKHKYATINICEYGCGYLWVSQLFTFHKSPKSSFALRVFTGSSQAPSVVVGAGGQCHRSKEHGRKVHPPGGSWKSCVVVLHNVAMDTRVTTGLG